jgi:hypothetical protein
VDECKPLFRGVLGSLNQLAICVGILVSVVVRRCRLTACKPVLSLPMGSALEATI